MNKVIFTGRLTADPEQRQSGDTIITRFNLAVDRRGKRDEADFFSCTAFNKLAEFAKNYLVKGTKILLEGRIQNNNYTDRDGKKVYGFQVIADSIEFAGAKTERTAEKADDFVAVPDNVDDEELPFN